MVDDPLSSLSVAARPVWRPAVCFRRRTWRTFAGGFRPDYTSWVNCPGAFDELGFPIHHEGASTVADGLYFIGVHYLRKRKSSLLVGVGEDATIVAGKIAATSR